MVKRKNNGPKIVRLKSCKYLYQIERICIYIYLSGLAWHRMARHGMAFNVPLDGPFPFFNVAECLHMKRTFILPSIRFGCKVHGILAGIAIQMDEDHLHKCFPFASSSSWLFFSFAFSLYKSPIFFHRLFRLETGFGSNQFGVGLVFGLRELPNALLSGY